jgi:hypothetical protein
LGLLLAFPETLETGGEGGAATGRVEPVSGFDVRFGGVASGFRGGEGSGLGKEFGLQLAVAVTPGEDVAWDGQVAADLVADELLGLRGLGDGDVFRGLGRDGDL